AEGVRPGWEILNAGGTDVRAMVRKLSESSAQSILRDRQLQQAVLSHLEGRIGRVTAVEFLDGANQRQMKNLRLGNPRGTLATFGYLTPQHVWFESSKLMNGRIGYVRFNIFL